MVILGEAALWYAKNGIPVLPLRPRTKEPYKDEGVYSATTDVAIVEETWRIRPAANIAIPMGPKSRLLGMDVDVTLGAPADRSDLIELYGEWGDTAEATSGRPGHRHLYFAWPSQLENVPAEIAPGIALRGPGYYMVAPPSVHPNGNVYSFDGMDAEWRLLDPADAPKWLLEMIAEATSNGNGTGSLAHWEEVLRLAKPEPELVVLPDEYLLQKALTKDDKFRRLYEGNVEGYPSQSEAEEALVTKLVFWFGHDQERVDRFYRKSGMLRPKWDRRDYWIRTMGSSFEKQTKVYEPVPPRSGQSNGAGASTGAATAAAPAPEKKKLAGWRSVKSIWQRQVHLSWLVEDFIPEQSLVLFSGDSSVGKSIFAIKLCDHLVHGRRFLNREVKRTPVLYLDRENPDWIIKERLSDFHIEESDNFRYWGMWEEEWPEGPESIDLLEYAQSTRGVIVFDTLVRFHSGKEQDASETAKCLGQFRKLVTAGATVILLHHSGKGESSKFYRGSSDIKHAVDAATLIERVGDEPAGLIQEIRLIPYKARLGAADKLQLKLQDGDFICETWRDTKEDVLRRLLLTYPGSGLRELIRLGSPGLTRHFIEPKLQHWVTSGKVKVILGLNNRGGYHLTEVTENDD